MARRKSLKTRSRPAGELVPRLRAAVKVVDEAISKLARTGAHPPRRRPRG
jgi:hypothetical protein